MVYVPHLVVVVASTDAKADADVAADVAAAAAGQPDACLRVVKAAAAFA